MEKIQKLDWCNDEIMQGSLCVCVCVVVLRSCMCVSLCCICRVVGQIASNSSQ